MAIYEKQKDSWVHTLKVISHNTWLHQKERKSILEAIENGISEDEAKELCDKYNREIESSIATWQYYQ